MNRDPNNGSMMKKKNKKAVCEGIAEHTTAPPCRTASNRKAWEEKTPAQQNPDNVKGETFHPEDKAERQRQMKATDNNVAKERVRT